MSDRQTAPESVEESRLAAGLLAVAAVGWTAAMLWSARASITSRVDAAMEVTSTAYALPGAVWAVLVAGAAVALLVHALIISRQPAPTARFAVATVSGLLVGLAAAVPIVTINTLGTIYAAVGGTVAAAATIGGALAGLRIPRVVAASAAASVGVFLIGFVLNLFQEPVLNAFGAGETASSSADAAQWFSYSQAALSGLAAGLVSYLMLRRAGTGVRWPMYALAGAGPGLLVVIGELLSRTAGAEVLELAGKVSELEKTIQEMLSTARLNNALIVLFVGALTAIIAVGRTLGTPEDVDPVTAGNAAASHDTARTPEAGDGTAEDAAASHDTARTPETGDGTAGDAGTGHDIIQGSEAGRSTAEDKGTDQSSAARTQSNSSSSETAYHSNS